MQNKQVRVILGILVGGLGLWAAHRIWHYGDELA